jgi:2,3-bisphosphoglycerate-independent phosphoglycerate mutase
LVDSPKVATYDLKPEMSAIEVAEKVAEALKSGKFPFVMNNFANPDMVGHTGKYDAAVKAIEITDKAIGIIYEACKENGYILFITSDHGNAEQMQDEKGNPHTAHTCNPGNKYLNEYTNIFIFYFLKLMRFIFLQFLS